MNHVANEIIRAKVMDALDYYGKPAEVAAVLHAGSSTTKPLDLCLDVDLIFLVNNADTGKLFLDGEGIRTEVTLVPVSKALEMVRAALRSQKMALPDMLISGIVVSGDQAVVSSIKAQTADVIRGAGPFLFREAIGFNAYGLLSKLKRASSPADVIYLANVILEFLGRHDGPLNNRWPRYHKALLRESIAESGKNLPDLIRSIQLCVIGEKHSLIEYLERWIEYHKLTFPSRYKLIGMPIDN